MSRMSKSLGIFLLASVVSVVIGMMMYDYLAYPFAFVLLLIVSYFVIDGWMMIREM